MFIQLPDARGALIAALIWLPAMLLAQESATTGTADTDKGPSSPAIGDSATEATQPPDTLSFEEAARLAISQYNSQSANRGKDVINQEVLEAPTSDGVRQAMHFNAIVGPERQGEDEPELTEKQIRKLQREQNWLLDGVQKLTGEKKLTDEEKEELADPSQQSSFVDQIAAQQQEERAKQEERENAAEQKAANADVNTSYPNPMHGESNASASPAAKLEPGTGIQADNFSDTTQQSTAQSSFGDALAQVQGRAGTSTNNNPYLDNYQANISPTQWYRPAEANPTDDNISNTNGNLFAENMSSLALGQGSIADANPFAEAINFSQNYSPEFSAPTSSHFTPAQPNPFQAPAPQAPASRNTSTTGFMEEQQATPARNIQRTKEHQKYFPQVDYF